MRFLEAVDGTFIAEDAITSIEPFKGGWGQTVHYADDKWKWVHPDNVAEFLFPEIFEET